MQKSKLSLLIVSGILMASSSLSVFASSYTSSFNVTGNIKAQNNAACNVDFGDGGNIAMSDVDIDDIAQEVGSVSKATNFKVHLTDCPASVSTVTARVDGTADYTDHTMLDIPTGNGKALGFGLQFLVNDVVLPLKEESKAINIDNGKADFTMGARYKTKVVHSSLQAGAVSAAGQLVLTYQ